MSKVAFVPYWKEFLADRMFAEDNPGKVGDDLFKPTRLLLAELGKLGIEAHTYDMLPLESFDAFVFCEMPDARNPVLAFARQSGKPTVLWVAENHFIATGNGCWDRYADFQRVLTYNDDVVARRGATRMSYCCSLEVKRSDVPFKERGLASMICSRHESDDPNLQYRERLKVVRFYEKNHPGDFALYGHGWDRSSMRWSEYRLFRKLAGAVRILRKLLPYDPHPLWKGLVERKRDVLGAYRFNYCYENTDAIPGYITEKILDALMNETVPIYRGHPSISKYIPKSCFIDRKDFASEEDLYSYIKNMDEGKWRAYIDAAKSFLDSPAAKEFSYGQFIDVWIRCLQSVLSKVKDKINP